MEKNQTSGKADANITHSGQPAYPSLRISTGIRRGFVLKTIKKHAFLKPIFHYMQQEKQSFWEKEPTFALSNIKHQSKKHEKKHFYFSLHLNLVPHKLYLTKNAGLHRLSVCLL
ncbi:MAG: hypothetical protein KH071_07855 [Paraprevotella sp.]|uniref:hypothetical protein n=1 Tax=Paraprevotella sp. TaxID=2049036 RepID=UPI00257FFE09|nr:hypothetical protein [Paraprevotella sp.]MBS4807793.1 hypothetical protein [Paraprevotella sp.]